MNKRKYSGEVTVSNKELAYTMVSNFKDISEKKSIEKQQEFEAHDLSVLINNTSDLMWSLDREYKLITFNKAFEDMMKMMSPIEITKGTDILAASLTPEQYDRYKTYYERAFAGEIFTEIEYNEYPIEYWSEISFFPIHEEDKVIGTACHMRDITNLKKTEQQLVINERRFRSLVENGNDGVVIMSSMGTVNYVSPSIERILGYTEEESLKLQMFSLIYPDDIAGVENVWNQVLQNPGIPIEGYTSRLKHKDGTWRWLESTVTNMLHDPSINGIIDNFRDVTVKINADKVLKNSEAFNRGVLNSLSSNIAVINASGEIIAVNESWKRFAEENGDNSQQSTGVGSNYYHVCEKAAEAGDVHALDVLSGLKAILVDKDKIFILEYPCNSPTQKRWFGMRALKFESDVPMIVISHMDITERKIAEDNLVESEARLKEAQALSHIGNWQIDLISNVHSWSDEFYNIFATSREKVQPSVDAFLSKLHPDDIKMAKFKVEKSFQTYEEGSFEARINRVDGSLRYICTEWKFEFDDLRNPIRLYGVIQDITERKMAEDEREKLTKDLIQRNRDLEQFTFIISHNLRAPTANIIGFTDNLLDESLTPTEQKEFLQGLSASVSCLDNIIKDINSILKVKREINEKKELISFSKLVKDINNSIGNLIDKHQVIIKTDFSEINEFFSLKVYMFSIFYNLISNSIKYSRSDVKPCIEIKSKKENGKIILTFKDNGLGIDLKTKGDKVFGLYKRFHTHIEGKGMGLFMVKTQVEAIGGNIRISSAVNKGTEFTIVFDN